MRLINCGWKKEQDEKPSIQRKISLKLKKDEVLDLKFWFSEKEDWADSWKYF